MEINLKTQEISGKNFMRESEGIPLIAAFTIDFLCFGSKKRQHFGYSPSTTLIYRINSGEQHSQRKGDTSEGVSVHPLYDYAVFCFYEATIGVGRRSGFVRIEASSSSILGFF